jgi:hypothetical protein
MGNPNSGRKGSPRIETAARFNIAQPNLSGVECLMRAGYKPAEATKEKRNILSKKKRQMLKDEEVKKNNEINNRRRERYAANKVAGAGPEFMGRPKSIAFQMTSHRANLPKAVVFKNKGSKRKKACALISSTGSPLKKKPGHLSTKSRRTPQQVLKKYVDDNKHKKQREEAYTWAMDLVYSEEE